MKRFIRLFVVMVYLVTDIPAVCSDLLSEVHAGNKATLESFQTIHCKVSQSTPVSVQGMTLPSSIDYWWSRGSSRVKSQGGNNSTDSVVHNSVARSIVTFRDKHGKQVVRYFINRPAPEEPHGPLDPWKAGLLTLCGPTSWPITLDGLIDRKHLPTSAERVIIDGSPAILVKLSLTRESGGTGTFDIIFDPAHNYLAKALTGTFEGAREDGISRRRESRVLRFKEVSPSQYFPEQAESRFYKDGQMIHHTVVRITDIRINDPISSTVFSLPVPPGAYVIDAIEDKEYWVDATSRLVGNARPLVKFPPLSRDISRPTDSAEVALLPSRWLMLATLSLLAIVVATWILQRYRYSLN